MLFVVLIFLDMYKQQANKGLMTHVSQSLSLYIHVCEYYKDFYALSWH
jgi:hypothetical protein